MNQQTQMSGNSASAFAPILSPFAEGPGWYERRWNGHRSPLPWGLLISAPRRLCREVPRVFSAWRAFWRGALSHRLPGSRGAQCSSLGDAD
jgi:hypothetical protein